MLFDTFLEWGSRHRTDDLVDELAALEEQERRDSHDHELLRGPRVLIRVHFYERYFACILLRELLDHGGDRPAWGAPLRPEVHDHVGVFLHDFVEVRIGDMDRLIQHPTRCARSSARLVRGGFWLIGDLY